MENDNSDYIDSIVREYTAGEAPTPRGEGAILKATEQTQLDTKDAKRLEKLTLLKNCSWVLNKNKKGQPYKLEEILFPDNASENDKQQIVKKLIARGKLKKMHTLDKIFYLFL